MAIIISFFALFLQPGFCNDLTGGKDGYFLHVPVGTRSYGMGTAYTALATGASAFWWNPAGLAFSDNAEFLVFHSSLPSGINWQTLAVKTKSEELTFAVAVSELSVQDIIEYNDIGDEINKFNYGLAIGSTAFSLRFSKKIAIGAAVHGFRQNFFHQVKYGYSLNVSARFAPYKWLVLGLQANNLVGKGLNKPYINKHYPIVIRSGIAFLPIKEVGICLDIVKANNFSKPLIGIETQLISNFIARCGYFENSPTWGLGLSLGSFNFDYAVATTDKYYLHNFSIKFKL